MGHRAIRLRLWCSRGLQLFAACAVVACGAELNVESARPLAPGGTAVLPLTLTAGEDHVAAVQFDLDWDESALTVAPVLAEEPRAAGKVLYTARLSNGNLRCLVAGMNAEQLGGGLIIRLYVAAQATAGLGIYAIHLRRPAAANPDGGPIDMLETSASVPLDIHGDGLSLYPEAVLNAASLLLRPLAPGEIVSIIGVGTAQLPDGSSADDVGIAVDGASAQILYTGPNQINFAVPFTVSEDSSSAMIEVQFKRTSIAALTVPVRPTQPGVFASNASGVGSAVAVNEDGTYNSVVNPARPGSVIAVYVTGLGSLDSATGDGVADGLPRVKAPLSVTIGGSAAEVLFAGVPAGLNWGVVQVQARVPPEIAGDAVSLAVRTAEGVSQDGVAISVSAQ